MDRENIASYTLLAYAVDNGSPPLKTSVQIFVEITDVDDNPPAFPEDSLELVGLKGMTSGKSILLFLSYLYLIKFHQLA